MCLLLASHPSLPPSASSATSPGLRFPYPYHCQLWKVPPKNRTGDKACPWNRCSVRSTHYLLPHQIWQSQGALRVTLGQCSVPRLRTILGRLERPRVFVYRRQKKKGRDQSLDHSTVPGPQLDSLSSWSSVLVPVRQGLLLVSLPYAYVPTDYSTTHLCFLGFVAAGGSRAATIA